MLSCTTYRFRVAVLALNAYQHEDKSRDGRKVFSRFKSLVKYPCDSGYEWSHRRWSIFRGAGGSDWLFWIRFQEGVSG